MPRSHKVRQIAVRIRPIFNAQETLLIDRLLDSGLYGTTREQVIRRIVDQRLCELFGKNGLFQLQK